jgi:hypothetical protein
MEDKFFLKQKYYRTDSEHIFLSSRYSSALFGIGFFSDFFLEYLHKNIEDNFYFGVYPGLGYRIWFKSNEDYMIFKLKFPDKFYSERIIK